MVPRMHCINTLFTVTSVEVYMLINDDFVCSRSSAFCVLYYIFFNWYYNTVDLELQFYTANVLLATQLLIPAFCYDEPSIVAYHHLGPHV